MLLEFLHSAVNFSLKKELFWPFTACFWDEFVEQLWWSNVDGSCWIIFVSIISWSFFAKQNASFCKIVSYLLPGFSLFSFSPLFELSTFLLFSLKRKVHSLTLYNLPLFEIAKKVLWWHHKQHSKFNFYQSRFPKGSCMFGALFVEQ